MAKVILTEKEALTALSFLQRVTPKGQAEENELLQLLQHLSRSQQNPNRYNTNPEQTV